MKYKFLLSEASTFGWDGLSAKAYSSKEDFTHASAARFMVNGRHGKVKTTVSDRVYLVLNGRGRFLIHDEDIGVKKDDVVIVPKNTPYDYEGEMELFLVHTPAFDRSAEVRLADTQRND